MGAYKELDKRLNEADPEIVPLLEDLPRLEDPLPDQVSKACTGQGVEVVPLKIKQIIRKKVQPDGDKDDDDEKDADDVDDQASVITAQSAEEHKHQQSHVPLKELSNSSEDEGYFGDDEKDDGQDKAARRKSKKRRGKRKRANQTTNSLLVKISPSLV